MQEPVSRQDASQPSAPLAAGLRLPFRHESRRRIEATAEALFSYLDDHRRLSGHMSKPSWMMAGASMQIEFDAQKGQVVGSRIRLSGRVLGLDLHVEEVVTEHTAPLRKVWATVRLARTPGDWSVQDGLRNYAGWRCVRPADLHRLCVASGSRHTLARSRFGRRLRAVVHGEHGGGCSRGVCTSRLEKGLVHGSAMILAAVPSREAAPCRV